jgi:hypothetical protein
MTSGTISRDPHNNMAVLMFCRLLDKIAKDILVCENRTIRRWDGSIADYKNHLRKKMVSTGAV